MSPMRILIVMSAFLLAGCADPAFLIEEPPEEQEETPDTPESEPQMSNQPVEPRPVARPHGTPEEEHGQVTTELDQGRWVAKKTVTISNGIGAAATSDLILDVNYADIMVVPSREGAYEYVFELRVKADTEQQAKDGLEQTQMNHEDTLVGDHLRLKTAPRIASPTGVVNIGAGMTLTYDAVLTVPDRLLYDFGFDGDYSDIFYDGLTADGLRVDADYSDIGGDLPGLEEIQIDMSYSDLSIDTDGAADIEMDLSYSEVFIDGLRLAGGSIWGDLSYSDVYLEWDIVPVMTIVADVSYSDVNVDVPGVVQTDKDKGNPRWATPGHEDAAKVVEASFDLSYSEVTLEA